MINKDIINDYVKDFLPGKRYRHTLGVVEMAVKLAEVYSEDAEKACIAALLHDVGKYLSPCEIIDIIDVNEKEDYVIQANPSIMHGKASAHIAKDKLNIQDEEILNAIVYHTTGRENMSMLEKIVFIADYIEPNRSFKGVEIVRKEAFENIDNAILMALDNTIKYIVDNGDLIHIDTIKARNYILKYGLK